MIYYLDFSNFINLKVNLCYDDSITNEAFCRSCVAVLTSFKCVDSTDLVDKKDYIIVYNVFNLVPNTTNIFYISRYENQTQIAQNLEPEDLIPRYVLQKQV